jgi:hypothetical protein
MNEPDTKTPTRPETGDLSGQVAALRRQATTFGLALIILSGTLNVYLYVQARRARNDLNALRPQANQIIDAYKRQEIIVKDFMARLGDYGRTHPDFVPILNKYRIPVSSAPAPTATTPPAPAQKK